MKGRRCALITRNKFVVRRVPSASSNYFIRVYLWDDFYRINGIDGINEERRASEFREFKEFKEFSEALSTFIHKAQQLIFSLNSLYSPSLLSSAALPIKRSDPIYLTPTTSISALISCQKGAECYTRQKWRRWVVLSVRPIVAIFC